MQVSNIQGNDNRELIIRKQEDGINCEAVIRDYNGTQMYDKVIGYGYTKTDAILDLTNNLKYQISDAKSDLDFIYNSYEGNLI